MYTFMINENNLKINTNLNGGSEIDVSKISIDNFDVSKNNLYLFRNPDFESSLEEKNQNNNDWKKTPEDIKEILLKEYISMEEYNKIRPIKETEKKLYEDIEDAKYANLKDEELDDFKKNIGLVDRENNDDDDEENDEAQKLAREQAEAEELARKQAEEQAKAEELARKQAEEQAEAEERAKKQAEGKNGDDYQDDFEKEEEDDDIEYDKDLLDRIESTKFKKETLKEEFGINDEDADTIIANNVNIRGFLFQNPDNGAKILNKLRKNLTANKEGNASNNDGQDSLDTLIEQQQQRPMTFGQQRRNNNNNRPAFGESYEISPGWGKDGQFTGGSIPTSDVITRIFGEDTSPPAIVGILENFNWGDDHIMVNDIKVRIPESYDEWFAKQTENMKKFVDDNKLSLDLIRFSNSLRENYQFYNPNFQLEKPVPDSETGVKYNGLVEKVDIEALQQLVKESHMRFRLHVQEFFGTLGLNPGIQVEISQLGGFINNLSVTEEQLNGGMIPMLVPFSLVSKVPSFMDDIEERLKSIIKRLENNGKKLVGDSKENIFKAVDRVKKQEKQLKVLANSLEKIVKDPLSKNEVTLDEVLKYSNKLEKGQIRGLDVAKTLVELEVN